MSLIKSITTRLSTVSNKSLGQVTEKCLHQTSCNQYSMYVRIITAKEILTYNLYVMLMVKRE